VERGDGGRRRKREPGQRRREGGFGPYGAPTERARYRAADRKQAAPREDRRSSYRLKGARTAKRDHDVRAARTAAKTAPARRRRRAPADVETEILRLGGRRGAWLLERLMAAADAFAHDRDRQAVNLLRPVRDAIPDSSTVHELLGLAQYRLGNYRAAAKELEEFVRLTDSVEQHPVLMDSLRAQRRWSRVEGLWEELAAASPSAELVTEGRIVAAGARADRGDLDGALALLGRKAGNVKRARPHHLRLWYALGDLEERAGNLARARSLFARVHAHDADFADVSTRLRALA